MTTNDRLRQQQRQNELRVFLDYEQRLRDAYARLQDPNPRGRVREDSVRGASSGLRRHR